MPDKREIVTVNLPNPDAVRAHVVETEPGPRPVSPVPPAPQTTQVPEARPQPQRKPEEKPTGS
jgi:hypothetical protein